MNEVLGRIASTAQELSHYHSGDGSVSLSVFNLLFWQFEIIELQSVFVKHFL
jgi:hypothetical protein